MTSAVNNINTLNTRVFHWGNLQRTKTSKALGIHLVNEMTEFFKKFSNPNWVCTTDS